MDFTKLENIEFGDVHMWDYPDFCDAFIEKAEINGTPLTEEELNSIPSDISYELLWEQMPWINF